MQQQGCRIVTTGCTGGLGFHALRHMLRNTPPVPLPVPSAGGPPFGASTSATSTPTHSTATAPPSPPHPSRPLVLLPPYHIILLARDPAAEHSLRARDELDALLCAVDAQQWDGRGEGTKDKSNAQVIPPPSPSRVELRKCDLADLADVRRAAAGLLADLESGSGGDVSAQAATSSSSSGGGGATSGTAVGAATAPTSATSAPATPSSPFETISPGRIDALLLNAGIAKGERTLVVDKDEQHSFGSANRGPLSDMQGRYEETACVNCVAQFLLLSQLLPRMTAPPKQATGDVISSAPPVPRIVFTSSALHRRVKDLTDLDRYFDVSGAPGDHHSQGTSQAAPPPWSLMKSYAASKYLQALMIHRTVQLLRSHFATSNTDEPHHIEVRVVEPGFVPATDLNRDSSWWARIVLQRLFPLLPFAFVQSLEVGARNIADALVKPLNSFQVEPAGAGAGAGAGTSSTGKGEKGVESATRADAQRDADPVGWESSECIDGVRVACVIKSGRKKALDGRVHADEKKRLSRWWPDVVQRSWPSVY